MTPPSTHGRIPIAPTIVNTTGVGPDAPRTMSHELEPVTLFKSLKTYMRFQGAKWLIHYLGNNMWFSLGSRTAVREYFEDFITKESVRG